jgi:hypothetical protein
MVATSRLPSGGALRQRRRQPQAQVALSLAVTAQVACYRLMQQAK